MDARMTDPATLDAVADEVGPDLTAHRDEEAVSATIVVVALTNLRDRIATTIREPTGTAWG